MFVVKHSTDIKEYTWTVYKELILEKQKALLEISVVRKTDNKNSRIP